MLEMIKSSYFIKFLFSLVDEKVKLKIIKYNISLQTELEISFLIIQYLVEERLL